MMGRWFKCSVDILFDVRFARLPAGLFRTWAQLSALASLNGGELPDLPQIAFALHSSQASIEKRLAALAERGLVILTEGVLKLADATSRDQDDGQAPLSGADRTRRWRERRAAGDDAVTGGDAPREEEIERKKDAVTLAARPRAAAPARPGGAYIRQGDPEWNPWADYWRSTKGNSPPTDRKGGWLFPSAAPPPIPAALAA